MQALGLIETLGFTTAVSAADAALKAADVRLVAVEKVIGVGGSLGVTIHLSGDVAAVNASVEAGKAEAQRVGKVISAHVIAKAHEDVTHKILSKYLLEKENAAPASVTISSATDPLTKTNKLKSDTLPASPGPTDSTESTDSDDKPN
ncbi:BMC domain-containing protein [Paenibacillus sp. 19GGS1-52]|uniref:BMC domain-containing protein n=1 Tax=Paenibacillus sp. 19GGS1-52 TaxID=2758563 RepID=UPI001EFABEEE|nr:BMC domain-containing protein [Paenibacillus sp. 19GGS1-52]